MSDLMEPSLQDSNAGNRIEKSYSLNCYFVAVYKSNQFNNLIQLLYHIYYNHN